MIQKHEKLRPRRRQAGRPGDAASRSCSTGPYFCQVQDPQYYSYTELIPDGPTTKRMQELAKQTGMVLVVPMYEEDAEPRASTTTPPP